MSYFQNIILSYFQNIFLLYLCVDLAQKGRKIAVRHLNALDSDIAIIERLKKQHRHRHREIKKATQTSQLKRD